MTDPTVSIILPTYEGESFLLEQLESIATQSRLPEELIIRDDASNDRTVAVAHRFAATAPFRVRVEQNCRNIGLSESLRRLVKEASSDIVFFCDQDDVWLGHKIERTLQAFQPAVDAVVTDSRPFDSETGMLGTRTVWEVLHGGLPAATLRSLAKRNFAAGHNLAVRRAALATASWPSQVWVDCWVAMVFAARETLALIPEPLVLYRQHRGNRVGLGGGGLRRSRPDTWTTLADTLDALVAFLRDEGTEVPPDVEQLLGRRASFLRARARHHERPLRYLLSPAREVLAGNYSEFAHGWRSLAVDLAAPLQAVATWRRHKEQGR